MVLLPNTTDYNNCIKAFDADNPDVDADYCDESLFYIKSKVKPDTDYLLTGIWKNSLSVFSPCIEELLKRLGSIISIDNEIENAVIDGFNALINFKNKRRKCRVFYCSDALKYCYIHLRVDSTSSGFGFHLTAYCVDK